MFKRFPAVLVCFTFIFSSFQPVFAQEFSLSDLPTPGTMVTISPSFAPALIKGLTVDKDNPFLFDFIVDPCSINSRPMARIKSSSTTSLKLYRSFYLQYKGIRPTVSDKFRKRLPGFSANFQILKAELEKIEAELGSGKP
jgi:hypothetical protein